MERVRSAATALLSATVIIAIWHYAIIWFHVPNYLMPAPGAVVEALKRGYIAGEFWKHLVFTLKSTLLGYVTGCGSALLIGAALAEWPAVERLVMPYIVALQSMPKVALAPLIIVWFGFGLESKIVMVALICFFPMFVNTVAGLRQTDPTLIEMMRAYSGSRWRTFVRIKVPAAAGTIFAGLQIAVVLSLIGAIVAEFISSTEGLGYLISAASTTLDTSVMFAALFSLAALGITGSAVVRSVHRKLVFWGKSASAAAKE
ncbi:ABC transporter permease [Bradyrhizobium uaiense]|uniref:ABC transporter permease n=1 Tax=Bradyrhizobium uaiense TaxID=2594946 RepID=A0A6P1BJ06_9BRAD|nr:ABC transporter permease [Bradyrhizobium uaiense]NEU98338.1 ABC transporter permease [Bradyrhizobium uaiense]